MKIDKQEKQGFCKGIDSSVKSKLRNKWNVPQWSSQSIIGILPPIEVASLGLFLKTQDRKRIYHHRVSLGLDLIINKHKWVGPFTYLIYDDCPHVVPS